MVPPKPRSTLKTRRYQIDAKELMKGGPAGYEATYLTREGDPVGPSMYNVLTSLLEPPLAVKNLAIRQRNGVSLSSALQERQAIGIVSGFKPSGACHFGHRLTASTVAFFQKNGVRVFVPVADLECHLDGKHPIEEVMFWAADNLLDWGADGVDLDAAHVYLQSEEHRVAELAYLVARSLQFKLAVDIYGWKTLTKKFRLLFAFVYQVGDILLPQHHDFANTHSFMVSGQDQDGHMKMTAALTKDALRKRVGLPGVKSVPSAFYIPHVRGLAGKKASSSKSEATLYLGPGEGKEGLEERTRTSLKKLAVWLRRRPRDVARCALDMVRFLDVFNRASRVDFAEIAGTPKFKKLKRELENANPNEESRLIAQSYDLMISHCLSAGQDNVAIVRETLPQALKEHHARRRAVLEYAVSRAAAGITSLSVPNSPPVDPPSHWKLPERAVVDPRRRNRTQWFHIIARVRDRLQP